MKVAGFSGLFHIICSLIIGGVLFYLLDPLVCVMEKKLEIKRKAVPGIVFAMLFAVLAGAIVILLPLLKKDLSSFILKVPEAMESLDNTTLVIFDKIFGKNNQGGIRIHFENSVETLKNSVALRIGKALDNATFVLKNIVMVIVDIITGIIFAYYFIKDKEKIGERFMGVFPYSKRNDFMKVTHEIGNIVSSFIKGQLTVAVVVGIIETVGLWMLGVPVPWLFGIIGGLSNIIPYVGPFIGAVPAVFVALTVSPWRAIFTALLFVLVQQLDNNFISPKIIEEKLGVHPVVSIIVIFIGGELWGIFGILLGIPGYAVLRCLGRYFVEKRIDKMKRTVE